MYIPIIMSDNPIVCDSPLQFVMLAMGITLIVLSTLNLAYEVIAKSGDFEKVIKYATGLLCGISLEVVAMWKYIVAKPVFFTWLSYFIIVLAVLGLFTNLVLYIRGIMVRHKLRVK